jgi:hypothetical protein
LTSTAFNNFVDASNLRHSHSNKSVLDGITNSSVSSWNKAEEWFYLDSSNNLHSRLNLIGDGEVAAWGVGSGSGSGSGGSNIIVIDNLTSNDSDNALSAKQGKVLKELIDNLEITGTDSHTHANLTVLNGITNSSVDAWNGAATNSHSHVNSAILNGINNTSISNWNTAYT